MAEMAIPAVRLRRRVEKKAELEMAIEAPNVSLVGEIAKIAVNLRNVGTEEIKIGLEARLAGRLIGQESLKLLSGTFHKWTFQADADPKANLISIVAQYSASGKEKIVVKRQILLPVKEKGAIIGIDSSALDVFDEK